MRRLILPGDPEFALTLGTVLPPAPTDRVFIVRAGSLILEPATPEEVDEYLLGGEYDQRLDEMDTDEQAFSGFNEFDRVELGLSAVADS